MRIVRFLFSNTECKATARDKLSCSAPVCTGAHLPLLTTNIPWLFSIIYPEAREKKSVLREQLCWKKITLFLVLWIFKGFFILQHQWTCSPAPSLPLQTILWSLLYMTGYYWDPQMRQALTPSPPRTAQCGSHDMCDNLHCECYSTL